jgi:hypothetical protein
MVGKNEFREFDAVRRSGAFNMLDQRARELTSLNKLQWIDILKNYDEYHNKWGKDNER